MKKTILLIGFLSLFPFIRDMYPLDTYKLIEKIDFGSGAAVRGSVINTSTEGNIPYGTATYGALYFGSCKSYYTRVKTATTLHNTSSNYVNAPDHTGNTNGYMMSIGYSTANTNYEIYSKSFTIPATTSDEDCRFTLYVANPVNIAAASGAAWKKTTVKLILKDGNNTALITGTNVPLEYAPTKTALEWIPLTIVLPVNQIPASRTVKISLNGIYDGAAWNEILLDDVLFEMQRKSDVSLSSAEPGIYLDGSAVKIDADMGTTDLNVPLYYRWQSSTDNYTYTDIPTATGSIASKSDPVSYTIPAIDASNLLYYRLIYAESTAGFTTGNYYKSTTIRPYSSVDLMISGLQNPSRYTTETYQLLGNTTYTPTWQVTGGSIVSGQGTNTIRVTWTEAANTNIVASLKADGFSTSFSLPVYDVTVADAPALTISGPATVSKSETVTYSLLNNNTGFSPTWEVHGGNIVSGQGTNTITVLWPQTTEISGNTQVIASFPDQPSLGVLTKTCSVDVSGQATVFSSEPGIYIDGTAVKIFADMSATFSDAIPLYYRWQSSTDDQTYADIPAATGSITLKSNPVNYTISAIDASNLLYYRLIYAKSETDFELGNYYKSTTIRPASSVGLMISGQQNPSRYTTETYQLLGNTNFTPTWRVSGGNIVSGQGTNTIRVTWTEALNTSIIVYLKAADFSSSLSLPVYHITIDDVASLGITGPATPSKMETVSYSLLNNNTGFSPTWEVYGGRIVSGQGTNTISVLWLHTTEVFINTQVIASFPDQPALGVLTTTYPVEVSGQSTVFSDETWFFGRKTGLIFKRDKYGDYTPTFLPKGTAQTLTDENSLSVSNPFCNGENVFYTSHDAIYNSAHQKFGTFAGDASDADGLACCYVGQNKYALFSVSSAAMQTTSNLNYYIVDMSANNGKGSISTKTVIASSKIGESIELIAVPGTKNEYWLLYAQTPSNTFTIVVKKIVANLDNGTITIENVNTYTFPTVVNGGIPHHIVSNPERNIILFSHVSAGAHLCRFNPLTGALDLSSVKKIYTGSNGYSAAFSPNGKFVYLSRVDVSGSNPELYQIEFDASQTPISSTSRTITMVKETGISGAITNNSQTPKLGPDNKIYINRSYHCPYISIIHTPDLPSNNPAFVLEQHAMNVSSYITSGSIHFGDEWSTGITSPAVALTGVNREPNCPLVTAIMPNSLSPTTVTQDVMQGVTDPDGHTVYLTGADFDDSSETRGTLSFDVSGGTVTFTPKGGAIFSAEESILIRYKVKDNGLPGARCSDGILSIVFGNYVPDRSPIIFVTPTAQGQGDGTSWHNTTANLQEAIDKARLSVQDVDANGFDFYKDGTVKVPYQVHMAKGTYSAGINFPATGLVMKEGVNVFVEDNAVTGSLASSVNINGDLYLDQYAEASAWRYFGMPFTGDIEHVFSTTAAPLSVNTPASGNDDPEVLIRYYDVARRGITGSSTEDDNSPNWKNVNTAPYASAGDVPYYSGNALLRGYGYITVADEEYIRIKSTNVFDKNTMFSTNDEMMPTVYFEHPNASALSPWAKTDYGWNLLSNPYSSYYRFDGTNHNFENPGNEEQEGEKYSLIYWSDEKKEYVALSRYDEAYLPPFKPVFFQIPSASANSFGFNNGTADQPGSSVKGSGRLGGKSIIREDWTSKDYNNSPLLISGRDYRDSSPATTPVMRSAATTTVTNGLSEVIFLEISGEGWTDKTSVVVNPQATTAYDLGWDLERVIYTQQTLPCIWTALNGQEYSTNELPTSADGKTKVPVHYSTGKTGHYRIGLGKNNRLSLNSHYYLENERTGEKVDLSAGDSFEIYASAGKTTDNLVLIIENVIKSQTSIDEQVRTSAIIYAKDKNICIDGISSPSNIEIFDISGRCIERLSVDNNKCNIPVNTAGVYIVSVKSKSDKQIKKVIINK